YKAYSDFFKLFVEVTEEEKGTITVDDLFAFVEKNINENVGENFIKICGPDGTGKSSFLMILYQYLYGCFQQGKINVYPYYIDLHYYEWKVVAVTDKEELRQEAEKCIRADLEAVAEVGKSGLGLLFLIDGNDNYFRTDLKPGPILESVLEDVKEDNIKIICIGEKPNVRPRRRRKANQFIERVTSYTFRFSPVYSSEQEKVKEIVKRYCALEGGKEIQGEINNCIKSFGIKEIDYNLLTIFQKCSERVRLRDITSLNGLYNRYCMIYLKGNEDHLRVCEQMAYMYFMTNEWIEQEFIAKHQAEWELVHQHKALSNYLIACYYADIILNCDENRKEQLESVFTNGINVFLKSIINEDLKNQADALKGCEFMFARGQIRAKAQAAYILGRIKDAELKENAKKILEEQKELLQKNTESRMDCFLLRTIYVSLLYLEESDAGEEFLASLIKLPVMNEVNRAFYLQYYDDIEQKPENVNGEIINLKDNGKDLITNTANVLLNYIELQLNVESQDWSAKESVNFQIHLFTLCSLLQIRIEKEDVKELLNKLKLIISRTLEQESANISDDMKTYLAMFQDDIENANYSSSHLYDELYGVKDIERSGWCKKIRDGSIDVAKYENVAEHMYYAWLMGMLYLPETAPADKQYAGYQKEEILRCLLTHDLAEKYVGDKLPEETTQEHKIKENEWMHKIFMHDTYNEIASMDAYRNIWEHFDLDSKNINGKIAKEIDIIQSIYQFCIYKEMGAEFLENREEKWKGEKNKIKTGIGKKILKEVVLKRFKI
ncbi:MAG: HD domain-containing protein, partial [Lachnospiraceae bacterium]|nr:HD domain-containing protein [Lachnospiraceae bacterium]